MASIKKFSACFVGCFWNVFLWGESGLSMKAEPILSESKVWSYFTNSLLMSLLVSLGIVLAVRWATRRGIRIVPDAGQACVEGFIDGIGGILEPIVGRHLFLKAFPLFLGYFVFILAQNLSGLIPGIGSIGFERNGHFGGILRPMNADLNATLALAIFGTAAWFFLCLKSVGARGFYQHIFGNKADKKEVHHIVYGLLFFIFLGVGLIECISIVFRVVSLSFRLYGNVFGGENLLHNMYEMSEFLTSGGLINTDFYATIASFSPGLATAFNGIVSKLGYFLPLPFYFLELLVSVVQAFVFTLLLAVYMGLICHHEEPEGNY